MYVIALIVLIAVLTINNALRKPVNGVQTASPATQRPDAPSLMLALQPGTAAIPLSSLKGKVVLLDFWATWCGPCKESIPDLENLYKKYHDRGLEVVGISVDKSPEDVPAMVAQLGMTYPVVMATDIPDIREKFKFTGIPQLYIIDRKGRIALEVTGSGHDLESEVLPFLEE